MTTAISDCGSGYVIKSEVECDAIPGVRLFWRRLEGLEIGQLAEFNGSRSLKVFTISRLPL